MERLVGYETNRKSISAIFHSFRIFFFLFDLFCNDDNPICSLSNLEKQLRSVWSFGITRLYVQIQMWALA